MKTKLNEMMSSIPAEKGVKSDAQALRVAIISELDAISLYEQLAEIAQDETLKKVLLDVAIEERTHVSEFETMLLKLDPEQEKEMKVGEKEVADLGGESTDMKEANERIYGKSQLQKLNEMKRIFNKMI